MRRLLPLALLAAAACIDDLEPPQYLVSDLRILAVRAEIPDADPALPAWSDAVPGDVVRLVALVANRRGAPIQISWWACPPELFPACPQERDLGDDASLAAAGLVRLDGETTCTAAGEGATCALSFSVPPAHALGDALDLLRDYALNREPTYQCRYYGEIGVVAVAEAGGRRDVAVKRVRLTPDPATVTEAELAGDYVRNSNPAIALLRGGPSEESCRTGPVLSADSFPTARTFVCGAVLAGAQGYKVCDASGSPTGLVESLTWQWYATGGAFPEVDGVGNATGGAPEFERPAGAFTLWAILRDGRGGVHWTALWVEALAP